MALLGTLGIGISATVAAPLLGAAAQAQSAPDVRVADSSLRYGQTVVVRGDVGAANAGRAVALEYQPAGAGWRVVQTGGADGAGHYVLRAPLTRSGVLRVAVGDGIAPRASAADGGANVARSGQQAVAVSARLAANRRRLDVLAGHTAVVAGTLRPGGAGRLVRLESQRHGRWRSLAAARTDARGRFLVRYRVARTGTGYVRLAFPGDAANARTVRRIGSLSGYRPAMVSTYDMYGGALACGGTLGYDSLVVANRTLPCGTRVRIHYGNRSVTATVRDRGPFVGDREFDLAGAVARRLGFAGVGTVWVSVG